MNNPFREEQLLTIVQATVAELLGRKPADLPVDAALVNDLQLDSLDFVELSYSLEKRLNLSLPKRSILDHAAPVLGDQAVLGSDGRLTALGLFVLENSFYRFASEQVATGMYPSDVMSSVTTRNWASLCHQLFNYLPEACPECRHQVATVSAALKVVCEACSVVVKPLSGDEALARLLPGLIDQCKAFAA